MRQLLNCSLLDRAKRRLAAGATLQYTRDRASIEREDSFTMVGVKHEDNRGWHVTVDVYRREGAPRSTTYLLT